MHVEAPWAKAQGRGAFEAVLIPFATFPSRRNLQRRHLQNLNSFTGKVRCRSCFQRERKAFPELLASSFHEQSSSNKDTSPTPHSPLSWLCPSSVADFDLNFPAELSGKFKSKQSKKPGNCSFLYFPGQEGLYFSSKLTITIMSFLPHFPWTLSENNITK